MVGIKKSSTFATAFQERLSGGSTIVIEKMFLKKNEKSCLKIWSVRKKVVILQSLFDTRVRLKKAREIFKILKQEYDVVQEIGKKCSR